MGFGKDGKGAIIRETVVITVGGLAAGSSIKNTGGVTLQTTSFRILKTEMFVHQLGAWAAEGDEVIIGICNGDLSVAEISESINVDGPVDRNDRIKQEQAERAVWLLVDLKEGAEGALANSPPANDGLPWTFNLRWTFIPTEGWDWFAFNPLAGALTAGAVFRLTMKHYGVWVD